MNTFHTINPFTETPLASYTFHTASQIEQRISEAEKAQKRWKKEPIERRTELLLKLEQMLLLKCEEFAKLITLEMGKPIRQSRAEILKCSTLCRYYAENGLDALTDLPVYSEAQNSFITFQPIGLVLGIMPWNFPFWQVFRFAIPTLLAGNGVVLKHAPNTTGCGLAIEQLLIEAGFPSALLQTLVADINQIPAIISHPAVQGVSLTGSTTAGRSVAALSGKYLKKTVLELGGSDPYLVLEDADLEKAIDMCVNGRLVNTGQSCIAAKRFLVHCRVYDQFLDGFTQELEKRKTGDPLDDETELGPMARLDLKEKLTQQVRSATENGATIHHQCSTSQSSGYFFPATILTNMEKSNPMYGVDPMYGVELFGPVATIIPCVDEVEMIRIANDTSYGLGAGIFSRDVERATFLAKNELEAGCVFINDFVKSSPSLPFGGIKESGYGRELSRFGILEFVNIKTIYQQP